MGWTPCIFAVVSLCLFYSSASGTTFKEANSYILAFPKHAENHTILITVTVASCEVTKVSIQALARSDVLNETFVLNKNDSLSNETKLIEITAELIAREAKLYGDKAVLIQSTASISVVIVFKQIFADFVAYSAYSLLALDELTLSYGVKLLCDLLECSILLVNPWANTVFTSTLASLNPHDNETAVFTYDGSIYHSGDFFRLLLLEAYSTAQIAVETTNMAIVIVGSHRNPFVAICSGTMGPTTTPTQSTFVTQMRRDSYGHRFVLRGPSCDSVSKWYVIEVNIVYDDTVTRFPGANLADVRKIETTLSKRTWRIRSSVTVMLRSNKPVVVNMIVGHLRENGDIGNAAFVFIATTTSWARNYKSTSISNVTEGSLKIVIFSDSLCDDRYMVNGNVRVCQYKKLIRMYKSCLLPGPSATASVTISSFDCEFGGYVVVETAKSVVAYSMNHAKQESNVTDCQSDEEPVISDANGYDEHFAGRHSLVIPDERVECLWESTTEVYESNTEPTDKPSSTYDERLNKDSTELSTLSTKSSVQYPSTSGNINDESSTQDTFLTIEPSDRFPNTPIDIYDGSTTQDSFLTSEPTATITTQESAGKTTSRKKNNSYTLDLCPCACTRDLGWITNISVQEKAQQKQAIIRHLQVNASGLSRVMRLRVSAIDDRTSSTFLASIIAGLIFLSLMGSIVLPDALSALWFINKAFMNCNNKIDSHR